MGTTNDFFRGLGTSGAGSVEDKDTWRADNAAGEPFGVWARRTRPEGAMDEEEQALARSIEQRFAQLNAAIDHLPKKGQAE